MEELFVVQKRPVVGENREEFYFRIVDTRTGEGLIHSFFEQCQAEEQCQRLNALAARDIEVVPQNRLSV